MCGRNVYIHGRENHACSALCIKTWISDVEAILILGNIRVATSTFLALRTDIMAKAPPIMEVSR